MRLKWLGHACFLLTFAGGAKLVTDPYGDIGYPALDVTADVVTVSHGHSDHNAAGAVRGAPRVVSGPGEFTAAGLRVTGIPTFHDSVQGKQRGENTVYIIEGDGLRLCHLGDLGHRLSEAQVAAIGKIDILLLPVGGYYTIDADQAAATARELQPAVIIPMHYKTDAIAFPITTADPFLRQYDAVEYPGTTEVELEPAEATGKPRVIILNFK